MTPRLRYRLVAWLAVLVAIGLVALGRHLRSPASAPAPAAAVRSAAGPPTVAPVAGPPVVPAPALADAATPRRQLPRLVDLGATQCVPCRRMAPILADLRQSLAGQLQVDFIDIRDQPEQAAAYGIRLIPTQVFIDATGAERFRHEGFLSRHDILAIWDSLGVALAPTSAAAPGRPASAPQ
jgi:thioredoxin 1